VVILLDPECINHPSHPGGPNRQHSKPQTKQKINKLHKIKWCHSHELWRALTIIAKHVGLSDLAENDGDSPATDESDMVSSDTIDGDLDRPSCPSRPSRPRGETIDQ